MGRGRSKLSMGQKRQLQKDLSTAKRNETRLKREYQTKEGWVLGFDWSARGDKAAVEYSKALAERDKAEARYREAVTVRERLERKLNRATTRSSGGPLF